MTHSTTEAEYASLLARLDDLGRAERREASARMVSVAGHLAGTPLNVIAGRAALLRANPNAPDVAENARRIEEQVDRLALSIRRLVDYFRLPDPARESRTVGELLRECRDLYGPIAALKGVSLGMNLHAENVASVPIDGEISPLIVNMLLSLAIRSTAPSHVVQLSVAEHAPRRIAFELTLPDLEPPPNFEHLEPPAQSWRYDPGTLETFWTCNGLALRTGGSLSIGRGETGSGALVRYECSHT
jgi:signal transduction histidine kinase